jgi:hypothetical protein
VEEVLADAPAARARFSLAGWALVTGLLLALALALMWHVWTLSWTDASACPCSDNSWATWVLAWPWQALRHGLNPFYSRAMFFPQGTNLLTYPGYSGLGIALIPVTALFGPVASLNVALLAAPVTSGLAATWLATRWISSRVLCVVAGIFYAFSPLVIVNEPLGHLNQSFLCVPPLVVGCLHELFWRRRHRPVRVGVVLGALLTAQFFISTEILLIIVVATVVSLGVLAVVAAAVDRRALVEAARAGAPGLLVGAGVAGVLLVGPALFAFYGPSHYRGEVWPGGALSTVALRDFFVPTGGFNLWWQHPAYRFLQPTYLAPGLLVVLLAGAVAFRRDRRLLALGLLGALSAWLCLGAWYVFAPWHWLHRWSVFASVVNGRFAFLVFLFVALALALVADHLRAWRPGWLGRAAAAGALVLAGYAYVDNALRAAPYGASRVWTPSWYREVAPSLPPGQVVLGFPFFDTSANLLSVQALGGMHYDIVGGTSPQWIPSRQGPAREGYVAVWDAASDAAEPTLATTATAPQRAAVLSALRFWQVDWIVIPTRNGPNTSPVARDPRALMRWMSSIVGPTGVHDHAWVWHLRAGVVPSGP